MLTTIDLARSSGLLSYLILQATTVSELFIICQMAQSVERPHDKWFMGGSNSTQINFLYLTDKPIKIDNTATDEETH